MVRQIVSPKWAWTTLAAVCALAVIFVVFRLGNQASAGVSLDDPIVWLEDGQRGEVLQINGSTREVTARVQISDRGDSVLVEPRGRDAVFLNRTTGELGVIGAVSLRVDFSETLAPTGGPVVGDHLELLADFTETTDAYIVDETRTLVVEPGAGIRLPIPTADGLGSTVVGADGRLVAVTADGAQLGVTEQSGLVDLAPLDPPIEGSDQRPLLARTGDDIYVVDLDRRTTRSVDADGVFGTATCVSGSLSDVVVGGSTLTTDDAVPRILVHDPARRVLSVSEPDRSECYSIDINLEGTDYGSPVAVDNLAFLPNYSTGRIAIVDLEAQQFVSSVPFSSQPGVPFELEVFGDQVWANEPQGPLAALVSRQGAELVRKIGRVVVDNNGDGQGDGGTVFAETNEGDVRAFGEQGDPVTGDGGNGTQVGGTGGDSVDGGDQPPDSPITDGTGLDGEEDPEAPVGVVFENLDRAAVEGLQANFRFSADTVSVGEPVTFTDDSFGDPVSWNWDFGDGTGDDGPDVVKIWEEEGIFRVQLFIADDSGNSAQQSVDITVVAADVLRVPVANFRFRSDTVEVGEVFELESLTTGSADLLLWDFGDDSTASGDIVEHQYDEAGTYEVTLTASNGAGADSTTATITVVEAVREPEAIIGNFPTVLEVGQSVNLRSESTNSPTTISWDFGDGVTALGSEVRHAWSRPDTYRVRLVVSNSAGESSTFRDVVIQPRVDPPVARFGESTLEAIVGEAVNFTDLSQNQPTRISWEFGDGNSASGPNVAHSWSEPGTYRVTLTASNDAGSDDVSKTITVLPLPPDPPVASFTVSSATVPVNSVVNFTDTSSNDPTRWRWDFGDGSTSNAQSPPHSFSEPGTYVVTLVAINPGGRDRVTQTIVVSDPPVAGFDVTTNELRVNLSDVSSNAPTSWFWDFGDGTTSTAENPTKEYSAPGNYFITLIATNAAGSSAPATRQVTVARRPNAGFEIVESGLTAALTDTSTNGPTAWFWDFGDGNTSSSQNPVHSYAAPGDYTITLTVSNAAGQSATDREVEVDFAVPVAAFTCQSIGATLVCDGSASTGAARYIWRAPDAVLVSGDDTSAATFTFDESGTYSVRLTVENANGDRDRAVQNDLVVVVPEPPEITGVTVVSNSGGVVVLQASASNSPTGWSWSAPDAVNISGGGSSNPTFTFDAGGRTNIFVIASNDVGVSDEERVRVNVNILSPPTITSINVESNDAGVVRLRGNATNNPDSWQWSAPEGDITAGGGSATPTIEFSANGDFIVRARAENDDGQSELFEITVSVTGVPTPPTVTAVNILSNSGGVVQVEGVASTGTTEWQWRLADASINNGSSATPTFTFGQNGTFNGDVRARNGAGWSARIPFTIEVTDLIPPPQAAFDAEALAQPGRFRLVNSSTAQAGATYEWSFDPNWQVGGGNVNPVIQFPDPGQYTITLTVTDAGGSDTDTDVINSN